MAEQKKQEQDTNQLLKVRREKLAELQANGKDPFQITKFNQTHHSLEVKEIYEAHEAELLKDHKEPEVEGLDEEQKKEVLKPSVRTVLLHSCFHHLLHEQQLLSSTINPDSSDVRPVIHTIKLHPPTQ